MRHKGVVISLFGAIAFAVFVVAVATISDNSGETGHARSRRAKKTAEEGNEQAELTSDPNRKRMETNTSETNPGSDEERRTPESEGARHNTRPLLTDGQAWTLRTGGRYTPARDVGKVWHSWPEKETKVEPPVEEPATLTGGRIKPLRKTPPSTTSESPGATENAAIAEPSAPTPQRIREVSSWSTGSEDTLSLIAVLLGNPAEPSALKLIAIEKLRAYPAERVVPILTAFLSTPAPAGGAYTKPTAVKVLFDLGATEALAKLAAESKDERVKLAIAALAGGGGQ